MVFFCLGSFSKVDDANADVALQEYYEEESTVKLYTSVLARVLITLVDEDEDDFVKSEYENEGLTVHEQRLRVWPPWPWPPWDPEDPDEPDHPGDDPREPHRPANRTKAAQKLAENIVDFEKQLAKASLDL